MHAHLEDGPTTQLLVANGDIVGVLDDPTDLTTLDSLSSATAAPA